MRHRRDHRQLSRTTEHRKALLRNLVTALFQYERIHTSVAKAKESRRLAERLITFAKRGDLAARRHVARFVYRETVAKKLFDTIAPWYAERPGGYTRIVRIGKRRVGDASEVVLLELLKSAEQKAKERKEREAREEAKIEAKKKGKRAALPPKGDEGEDKPKKGREKSAPRGAGAPSKARKGGEKEAKEHKAAGAKGKSKKPGE
jgi:large subunit ribosomal protein L17